MLNYHRSREILESNKRFIPGGVISSNRAVKPEIVFAKAVGAYLWDVEGTRYIDYHAAFGPYLLGHNNQVINAASALSRSDPAVLLKNYPDSL